MPRFSKEWTENVIVIPENALLHFSRRDAQIARNWSKSRPGRDIFDEKKLAAV
jgi:hypothetical protein